MQVDIANQAKGFAENRSGNTPAAEMLKLFRKDPADGLRLTYITDNENENEY